MKVEGSHGENLTIMEKDPSLPLEQTTRQVLQSFIKDLMKEHDKSDNTKQPAVAAFIQLIPSSGKKRRSSTILILHYKHLFLSATVLPGKIFVTT